MSPRTFRELLEKIGISDADIESLKKKHCVENLEHLLAVDDDFVNHETRCEVSVQGRAKLVALTIFIRHVCLKSNPDSSVDSDDSEDSEDSCCFPSRLIPVEKFAGFYADIVLLSGFAKEKCSGGVLPALS